MGGWLGGGRVDGDGGGGGGWEEAGLMGRCVWGRWLGGGRIDGRVCWWVGGRREGWWVGVWVGGRDRKRLSSKVYTSSG